MATSQQQADILLAEYQAERRARLANFYEAERNAGAAPLIANERLHFHAKRLDAEYEADLNVVRSCTGRK